MKNRLKSLKRICSVFVAVTMSFGIFPANHIFDTNSVQAAYTSQYPSRIIEEHVFDDIEGYEVGSKASKLGMAWWPAGNNQNDFAVISETDGQQAISYTGVHGYSTFTSISQETLTGNIWIDMDIKLPSEYTDFRVQMGDSESVTYSGKTYTGTDRVTLYFLKENTELRAWNVQNPAGAASNVTLTNDVPQEEWFTVSVCINTETEFFTVYLNGEQVGGEMSCNHKYDHVKENAERLGAAGLSKISFANRTETNGGDTATFYLDNFRIAYGKQIEPVEDIEVIVDKGDSYTLPETLSLMCDDGKPRTFDVEWTADGAALDTNTVGAYYYTGTVENYDGTISLLIYVKERTVASVETVFDSAYKTTEYILPSTVPAIMSDGNKKQVPVVQWQDSQGNTVTNANTDSIGTVTYYAYIEGYSEPVEFILSVIALEVRKIDDIYDSVETGGKYTMPQKVKAVLADNQIIEADVESWSGDESQIDTSRAGKYSFTGHVDGYDKKVSLTVTVYEKDSEIDYFMTILEEFYTNCITVGRDRSYINPEWTNESGKNPLFALGIDSATGQMALWQGKSGNYPLSAIATQGPLMKALEGMTFMTGEDKYFDAVVEAYEYMIENKVNPDSGFIWWGDHCIQNMYDENYAHFDTDEYLDAHIHQIEQDFPNYDLLYRLDEEKTSKYIEAIWRAHFNGSNGVAALDTLEFTRHANLDNTWSADELSKVFDVRYPDPEPYFASNKLTYINAAADFIYAAVKMWENTGDEDALHWGLKLLDIYYRSAHPVTRVIPFQFTDTVPNELEVKDVYDDYYLIFLPVMRMEHTFPQFVGRVNENGEPIWLNDYATLMQGTAGGGSYNYSMMGFEIGNIIGGELGKQLKDQAVETLEGYATYIYNDRTGNGNNGLIDGTNMTDAKTPHHSYYQVAGRTAWPLTITPYMSNLALQGWEHSQSDILWNFMRSLLMRGGIGDIGTAPSSNKNLEMYTDCDEHYYMMVLARLYELTGDKDYYTVAKRIATNMINTRFKNGYFFAEPNYRYARLASPEGYALLYLVAAAQGKSQMLPRYMGESYDFQLDWRDESTGELTKSYGNKLFNQTIDHEVLVDSVTTDITREVMRVGDKIQVTATVSPSNAEDTTLDWYSDNKQCAIVDKNGKITALAPGKAVITAEAFSGVYADITIIVE